MKVNESKNSSDKDGSPAAPEKKAYPRFKNNRELLLYLFVQIRHTRKWFLLPILLLLAIIGLFVSLTTGNSSILPAIYALF